MQWERYDQLLKSAEDCFQGQVRDARRNNEALEAANLKAQQKLKQRLEKKDEEVILACYCTVQFCFNQSI